MWQGNVFVSGGGVSQRDIINGNQDLGVITYARVCKWPVKIDGCLI